MLRDSEPCCSKLKAGERQDIGGKNEDNKFLFWEGTEVLSKKEVCSDVQERQVRASLLST